MKKTLLLLIFLISSWVIADVVFYGSGTMQNLENKMTFKNTVSSQSGSVTPTTGVSASTGSVYQKDDGTFWVKDYGANTAWNRIATSSELNNYVSKTALGTEIMQGGLAVGAIQATGSAGMHIHNNSGNNVAIFGAGGGTGASFAGGINVTGATTLDTLNGFLKGTSGVISTSSVVQTIATGSAGGDFNVSSIGDSWTLNIPDVSSSTRGAITPVQYNTFATSIQDRVIKGGDTMTGTLVVPNITLATFTGVIRGTSGVLGVGSVALGSEVSGTLPVANGGTGATTLTSNGLLVGNGTSAVSALAPGSAKSVVVSNGTSYVASSSLFLGGDLTLDTQNDVRFADSDSSNFVALQATGSVGTNYTLTLPNAQTTIASSSLINSGDGNLFWMKVPEHIDWVAYTPTWSSGFSSVSSNFYYRKIGKTLEIKGNISVTTSAANPLYFSLPAGYSINTTIHPSRQNYLGLAQRLSGGVVTAGDSGNHFMLYYDATPGTGQIAFSRTLSSTDLINTNGDVMYANGDKGALWVNVVVNE